MQIQSWSQAEANSRARRKVLRIIGKILLFAPVVLFVHVLLIFMTLTLFVTFIGALPMYLKWSGERVTCLETGGVCPSCKTEQKLRTYISAQFKNPMTLQCPACGQTCKAYPVNEADVPVPEYMAQR